MKKTALLTLIGLLGLIQPGLSAPPPVQGFTVANCQAREKSLADSRKSHARMGHFNNLMKTPIWSGPTGGWTSSKADESNQQHKELEVVLQGRVDECWAEIRSQRRQQQQQPQNLQRDADLRSKPSGSGYGNGF